MTFAKDNLGAHARIQDVLSRGLVWTITATSLAAIAYGLFRSGVLLQPVWSPAGLQLLLIFAGCYTAASVGAYFVARRSFPALAVMASSFFMLISVGIAPTAAAFCFLLACQLAGDLLFKPRRHGQGDLLSAALSLAGGIAVYLCLVGLLVYLPINYPICYWALVLAPILINWRAIPYYAAVWRRLLRAPAEPLTYAATALLGFCLLAHFLVALKPEVGYDALAMHLYIPGYVAARHYWPFDTNQAIWALMPMAGDWGYTITFMLGGEYAARLLNFAAMLLVIVLLVKAVREWIPLGPALLLGAALASSPFVQLVTGSLFIDNFVALWMLTGTLVVVRFATKRHLSDAFLCAVLLGCAVDTKFAALAGALLLAGICIGLIIATLRRSPGKLVLALVVWLALFATAGLPPYMTAYILKRNPVYPFLPVTLGGAPSPVGNVLNTLYRDPLRWSTLYDLTFDSGRYLESQNGSFGLHHLFLIPLAIAGLVLVRRTGPSIAVTTAVLTFVSAYVTQSYIRYLYPSLPLFAYAAAAVLGWMRSHQRRLSTAVDVAFVILIAINIYLLPASGWLHKQFFLPDLAGDFYRQSYLDAFAPVRRLTDYLNFIDKGGTAAYLGTNQIAGLQAKAYTLTWHHSWFLIDIRQSINAAAVGRVMKKYGIRDIIAPKDLTDLPKPVQDYLRENTRTLFTSGNWNALRPEINFVEQVIGNGGFDQGTKEWVVFGKVRASKGTVEVTNRDTLSQSFTASEGERFRYRLTASCPVAGTMLRLQVNWVDRAGRMTGVSLDPEACTAAEATYEATFEAPSTSVAGVAFVAGHDSHPVIVHRISLER